MWWLMPLALAAVSCAELFPFDPRADAGWRADSSAGADAAACEDAGPDAAGPQCVVLPGVTPIQDVGEVCRPNAFTTADDDYRGAVLADCATAPASIGGVPMCSCLRLGLAATHHVCAVRYRLRSASPCLRSGCDDDGDDVEPASVKFHGYLADAVVLEGNPVMSTDSYVSRTFPANRELRSILICNLLADDGDGTCRSAEIDAVEVLVAE